MLYPVVLLEKTFAVKPSRSPMIDGPVSVSVPLFLKRLWSENWSASCVAKEMERRVTRGGEMARCALAVIRSLAERAYKTLRQT